MTLRDVFLWLTGIFWIGVGYHAVRCPNTVPCDPQVSAPAGQSPPLAGPIGESRAASAPAATQRQAPRIPPKPGLREITAAELAKHSQPDDCWIAIAGTVYDLSGYVDLHPSKQQEMDGYCGKEGTKAWDLKDTGKEKGQPHTKRAAEFLGEYPQIGTFRK